MDYTLNVFGPETNMMGKTEDKDELARKAGCQEGSQADKPVLIQLLENYMSGDIAAAAP
jgi:hypothetical protein